MKVLVIGATGYIGFRVACALRRAGHQVWGLARSETKGNLLAEHEIHPVIGNMEVRAGYESTVKVCSLLIYCAFDPHQGFGAERAVVERLLSMGRLGAQPKTVIYTSGVWVHGNTGESIADEATLPAPPRLVASRPATEQVVMGANDVRTLIIRPGCVYGGQGGMTGMWFKGAHQDMALSAVGDGRNRWAMVHVDDLAQAYLRAAESDLNREIFDIVDYSRSTVGEMVEAVKGVSGYEGDINYIPVADAAGTMGDFAECLALDQRVDAGKAARLLGWRPRHLGFVDEVDRYFKSWKASQPG